MKRTDLATKNIAELQALLDAKRAELVELAVEKTTSEFKTHHRFGLFRKEIAQILTTINAQRLAEKD